jgi:hypothetical protein
MKPTHVQTWSAAVAMLLVALWLYVPATSPTITLHAGGVDGGELAATALSGGVPHPPGYPTYMLLARLFLRVAGGEPAGRLAMLSAFAAASCAACTTALIIVALRVRQESRRDTVLSLSAGFIGGVMLVLGERFWSQALIAEVYALHMFALSLVTLALLLWFQTGAWYWPGVGALALGFGTGTHLTILVLVPALLIAAMATPTRPVFPMRAGAIAGIGLLGGLSVYGLLPPWAARNAIPSWGNPGTFSGFWNHVSGAEYHYLSGIVPWNQRLGRVGFAARDLLRQPGPIALLLALWWGLPWGWRFLRPLSVLTAVIAGGSLLFAVSYGGVDGTVYLLPWTWAWTIWAGIGLFALLRSVGGSRHSRWLLLGGVIVLVLGWGFWTRHDRLDLRAETAYRDRMIAYLSAMPTDAVLLTTSDAETFGAWYVQKALEQRRDVVVVDTRLLARAWYRAQLAMEIGTPQEAVCSELVGAPRQVFTIRGDTLARVEASVLRQACEA